MLNSLQWPIITLIKGHWSPNNYNLLCLCPQLAKRYGNVYSLFIGHRPVVIVNGLQALKEALVNKAADFSGRPQDLMINHAVQVKGTEQV